MQMTDNAGKQHAAFKPESAGIYHFIARADRWQTRIIDKFRHWLTSTIAKEHPDLVPSSS